MTNDEHRLEALVAEIEVLNAQVKDLKRKIKDSKVIPKRIVMKHHPHKTIQTWTPLSIQLRDDYNVDD